MNPESLKEKSILSPSSKPFELQPESTLKKDIERFQEYEEVFEGDKAIGFKIPNTEFLFRYLEDGSWLDENGISYNLKDFDDIDQTPNPSDKDSNFSDDVPTIPDEGDKIKINELYPKNSGEETKSSQIFKAQDIFVNYQNRHYTVYMENVPQDATIEAIEQNMEKHKLKDNLIEMGFYKEENDKNSQSGFIVLKSLEDVKLLATLNGQQFFLGSETQIQFYLQNEIFPSFPSFSSSQNSDHNYVIKSATGQQIQYESSDSENSDDQVESDDEDYINDEEDDGAGFDGGLKILLQKKQQYYQYQEYQIVELAQKQTRPPFEIYFQNAASSTTREDIFKFFDGFEKDIENIRFYPDPENQFEDRSGVVIFQTNEALIQAASANWESFNQTESILLQIKIRSHYFQVNGQDIESHDIILGLLNSDFKLRIFNDYLLVPLQESKTTLFHLKINDQQLVEKLPREFQYEKKKFYLQNVRNPDHTVTDQFKDLNNFWRVDYQLKINIDQTAMNFKQNPETKDIEYYYIKIDFDSGKANGKGFLIITKKTVLEQLKKIKAIDKYEIKQITI